MAWRQIGAFGLGLGLSYLAASVSESWLHRCVGHAGARTRRFWARHPWLFGHLLKCHYRHSVVHHGLTFRADHVTQFRDGGEQAEVDRKVEPRADPHIRGERYGLTIGPRALVTYNATVLPIVPVLFAALGPWAAAGALPALAIAPLCAMLIHPYLHRDHSGAVGEAPPLIAALLRTRYFRAVARHHFLHHKYTRFNFNLMLGGDYLLGTHRWADAADRAEMAALGLPAEQCERRP